MSSPLPSFEETGRAATPIVDLDAGVYLPHRIRSFAEALLRDRAVLLSRRLSQTVRTFGMGNVGAAGQVLTPILADVYDNYRLRQLMDPFGLTHPLGRETQRGLAVILTALRFLGNCDTGARRDALRAMIVTMLDVEVIHELCLEEEHNLEKALEDARRIFDYRNDDRVVLEVMEELTDELDGEGNRMKFAYRLNTAMVLGYEAFEEMMGELGGVLPGGP